MKGRILLVSCWLLQLCACSDSDTTRQGKLARLAPSDGGVRTSCGGSEESFVIDDSSHVDGGISYDDPPPAGGIHSACWTTWGVHSEAVGDEHWVHNLEHGGIVYLYSCGKDCSQEVKQLAEFVEDHEFGVLTPYADMPTKFAVVAWGHRLLSDCYDAEAFEAFYAAHVDQAPESVSADPPTECR